MARFRAATANPQGMWDDRNLRNSYYAKIAPRLRAQFVSSGTPVPASLDPLVTVVERFDRAYWADFELNRSLNAQNPSASKDKQKGNSQDSTNTSAKSPTTNKPSSTTPKAPTTNNNTPATTGHPTKNKEHLTEQGKLTEAERQRRMDTGACLYCGKTGHFAKDCDKKTSAKAAVVTQPSGSTPVTTATPPATSTARASYTVNQNESDDSGKD